MSEPGVIPEPGAEREEEPEELATEAVSFLEEEPAAPLEAPPPPPEPVPPSSPAFVGSPTRGRLQPFKPAVAAWSCTNQIMSFFVRTPCLAG